MRATGFITERKRKKKSKKAYGGYFYPGYSFVNSSDSGGDGGGGESVNESPEVELAKTLPSLAKHDYNAIEQLVRKVAHKHKITKKALDTLFQRKYKDTPDRWLKGKLDETDVDSSELDIADEVQKFAEWASRRVNLKSPIKIELSMDTDEAQTNHHTGGHMPGSDTIWVYANNRNLVDILRTVFHEIVHVRQGELGMIDPGDSYPGSPIEVLADALAGKYIKIYGEKNNHIFQ